MTFRTITPSDLRDLTKRAGACEFSVLRRLVGLPVRGSVRDRIDKAIRAKFATS